MHRIFLIIISIIFFSCAEEEKTKEGKNEGTGEQENEKQEVEKNEEYSIKRLSTAEFYSPYQENYSIEITDSLQFGFATDYKFHGVIRYKDGSKDNFSFSGEKIIAQISSLSWSLLFHQQISIYLSEKQWLRDSVKAEISNPEITRYEIVNPPFGKSWYLNALKNENGKEKIIASYQIQIPEGVYQSIFKKNYPSADLSLLNYRWTAPEMKKIEYNSLRNLKKFYEGMLGNLNGLPLELPESYKNHIFFQKNKIETLDQFYDSDYTFPSSMSGYYDTTSVSQHSLSELFTIKAFSYKTAYPIDGGKDSTLEMQIDFKTRENIATIRFVMGGILLSELPRLKNNEFEKGMYFPLGFSKYKNPKITQESYFLMGNTSGLWSDNILGRNIDGAIIYLDKIQKQKIHIWLMGGDGTLPVGHYVALLDKIIK